MPLPTGAPFAAAAGSSLVDMIGSSIMSNSANAKSKRAIMLQYALANQLMDKQNEYNKPINQMARLREAGLNPNLVYGDGGATIASASGGNPSAPDITPASGTFGLIGKMQALQSMKQSEANIDETKARTASIDENIALKKQELDLRTKELNAQVQLIGKRLGLTDAQIDKVNAETRIKDSQRGVTFSSDPIGYIADIGMQIGGAYNKFYDYVRDKVAPKIIKKGGRK